MTSVNNKMRNNKHTYLQGVQPILHLHCEFKPHIKWPVLGYCLTEHQQNNKCCNYLQANEKMFFSLVEWPTRQTLMWLLSILSFFLFSLLPSFFIPGIEANISLCVAQIALLASACHTRSLMRCTSSLLTKEVTAGVITEIWDLTKL